MHLQIKIQTEYKLSYHFYLGASSQTLSLVSLQNQYSVLFSCTAAAICSLAAAPAAEQQAPFITEPDPPAGAAGMQQTTTTAATVGEGAGLGEGLAPPGGSGESNPGLRFPSRTAFCSCPDSCF